MTCRRAREIDLPAYLLDPRGAEWQQFRAHFPACEDCWEEVSRWSKLEGLVSAAAEPAEPIHPAEATLLRYVDVPERLAVEERSSLDLHLRTCEACREDLAALRAFDLATAPQGGVAQTLAPKTESPVASLVDRLRDLLANPVAIPALAAIAVALLLFSLVADIFPESSLDSASSPEAPEAREPRIARETPPAPPVTGNAPTQTPEHLVAALPPAGPEIPPAVAPPVEKPAAPRAHATVAERAKEVATLPEPVAPAPKTPALPEPILIAALDLSALPSSAPIYAPRFGLERARIDALVRGAEDPHPEIFALVPEEVGVTTREQPDLYWFIAADTRARIDFALIDSDSYQTLLEFTLESPALAGFHAVRLSDTDVRLKPDVSYQWSVAVVADAEDRGKDLFSAGGLRRVAMADALASELGAAPVAKRAHILAREGIWYDALDALSDWIAANPHDASLRAHRAALLSQVGLDEPAGLHGAAAGSSPREP